jgi:hypothetical protein
MSKIRLVAICAAVVAGAGASAALAGEVKGPPQAPCGAAGQPACTPSTNDTAAPAHAKSLCAYSGLNDMGNGQTARQTQTPKDAAPGSAAHGWTIPDGNGGTITISCNPNGVVG